MKRALLLIDLQNDYFQGGKMELAGSDKAAGNASLLLDMFRETGGEIIHIQHIATGEGSSFFLPNTEGVKIHNKVTPLPDETVIVKHFPNSFRQTELREVIKNKQIDHLVPYSLIAVIKNKKTGGTL